MRFSQCAIWRHQRAPAFFDCLINEQNQGHPTAQNPLNRSYRFLTVLTAREISPGDLPVFRSAHARWRISSSMPKPLTPVAVHTNQQSQDNPVPVSPQTHLTSHLGPRNPGAHTRPGIIVGICKQYSPPLIHNNFHHHARPRFFDRNTLRGPLPKDAISKPISSDLTTRFFPHNH